MPELKSNALFSVTDVSVIYCMAAMFVPLRGAQRGRLYTKLYKSG